MATVQSDIFKPTKFGGKYTVTLIPGEPFIGTIRIGKVTHMVVQVMVLVLRSPNLSRPFSKPTMFQ